MEDMLESLISIDPAVLLEVARQDLDLPAFELIDGSVTPLRHEKVIETTGGLSCLRGNGLDGSQVKPGVNKLKLSFRHLFFMPTIY